MYFSFGVLLTVLITKTVEMRHRNSKLKQLNEAYSELAETRGRAVNACLASLHSCGLVVDERMVEIQELTNFDGLPQLQFVRVDGGIDWKVPEWGVEFSKRKTRREVPRASR